MSGEIQSDGNRTVDTRKEPRFTATNGAKKLQCETTLAVCGIRRGEVVDISKNGIRLLCDGSFEVGQPIFTELTTDRSHGIYQGMIRRVERWPDGGSILGCSLDDPIPDEILEQLAGDGVVSRVSDLPLGVQRALNQQPFNQEGHEFDHSGDSVDRRNASAVDLPTNVRLRVRFDAVAEEDPVIVEAKAIWCAVNGLKD